MLDVSTDYLIFDNLVTLKLKRTQQSSVDFSTGILGVDSEEEIQIENCLIRQISERLVGTVRQIFERGKSITNDNINLADTIIEIPILECDKIEINDTLYDSKRKWMVLAKDTATLDSRFRVACRSI